MAYGDNISRQAAIDAIDVYMSRFCKYIGDQNDTETYAYARGLLVGVRMDINAIPTAQHEIIHCKDCIHNKEPDFGFCEWANHHVSANSCCADVFHAERRTDG